MKKCCRRFWSSRRNCLLVAFSAFSTILGVYSVGIAAGDEPSRQEILDSVLSAPELIIAPGPEYDDACRDYNMNCGVARTPAGRLWACSISGGDSEDAYFVSFTSDDDGKNWSKPRLVVDPPEIGSVKRRVLIAEFWTDPSGRLWLFFDYGLAMFDGRVGVWATRCDNPDAELPVWTKPVRIADGSVHNKPTITRDGTWLLPVELYARSYCRWNFDSVSPSHEGFPELDPIRGISVYASDDQGATWTVRGRCVFPVSAGEEPIIVEKQNGDLWLLARTPVGMHQSFSTDGGRSWSDPVPAFKNPTTRFFLTRLKSGAILFLRHGTPAGEETRRARLTACLSDDDGETWTQGLLIDERDGVSYPDGFQAPDGRIYVTYDRDRGTKAEILLAVFTEDDVRAGKDVSGSVRLKQIVSKATGREKE